MSAWITPEIPSTQRNFTRELDAIYRANQRYAPQQFALEEQYGPQYNRIAIRNLAEGVQGFDDEYGTHIPGQLDLSRMGTDLQRYDDIAAVQEWGGAATEAQLAANPWLHASLDDLNARAGAQSPLLDSMNADAQAGLEPWYYSNPLLSRMNEQAMNGGGQSQLLSQMNQDAMSRGTSPLLARMQADAEAELAAGGALTPEQETALAQSSLAGFAARGNAGGNQAVARSVLNRDAARTARMGAARQFASGVEGLTQADLAERRAFTTGVEGLNLADRGEWRAFNSGVEAMNQGAGDISLRNLAQRQNYALGVYGANNSANDFAANVARLNASSLVDPFAAVLGRQGITAGSLQPVNQNRAYNPFDAQAYGNDVFTWNANANQSRNIAQANSEAATRAAIASISGSAIGLASDERLKQDIVHVGTSPQGFPIVEFNYNSMAAEAYGLPTEPRFRGTLAQAVEKILPQAVHTRPLGFKTVDYELIDVAFEEVKEFAHAA